VQKIHRLNDNLPDSFAAVQALREIDRQLPDHLWRILSGYSPNRPTTAWDVVRPFVIECVISMKPRTYSNARRSMTMTALYVAWVWTVTGCELTAGRVFSDALIRRYLSERLAKHSDVYRFDTARQLAATAEALTANNIHRLPTPPHGGRVRPYSATEQATLYSWANTLTTALKRQNARALLSLAGGAGLTALELMAVQVEDVELAGARAFVHVTGDRARRVPVRANWVRTLTHSVGPRTDGNLFQAYRLEEYPPHELQIFLSDNPCSPRPSAARLHSGWVVSQIDAGLPLGVLLEITGFTSAQSLQPYLKYAKTHRLDPYIARITGEEAV
jgi:hypothetical protein